MATKKESTIKNILIQLIVDVLEKSGNKPLNYKQVAAALNISEDEERQAIRELLNEESRHSGVFKEVSKGKYILKEIKAFAIGRIDMTADGSAFVVLEDEFEDDIYIAPRKL